MSSSTRQSPGKLQLFAYNKLRQLDKVRNLVSAGPRTMNAPLHPNAPAAMLPRPHLLSFAVGASLACIASTAWAFDGGQVVADGVAQTPPGGEYSTTADSTAGYVFHALNGGSITAEDAVTLSATGESTAAIRAERGGSVTIRAGIVETSGLGSTSIWATDGGRVELFADPALGGITVATSGDLAPAARAENGRLLINAAALQTSGRYSHGIVASGISQVDIVDGAISTTGVASVGIDALTGSRIGGTGVSIATSGASADGVRVGAGASMLLSDSQITTTGMGGGGVHGFGQITLRNVDISTSGGHAAAIWAEPGSSFTISDGTFRAIGQNSSGMRITHDIQATIDRTDIFASYFAINLNGDRNDVQLVDVNLHSSGSQAGGGIWAPGASTLRMNGGSITTVGNRRPGIDNRESRVDLENVAVRTDGTSSHGLYASMDVAAGPSPILQATGVAVETSGEGAIGAAARLGGQVHLLGGSISTGGARAYGVLSSDGGALSMRDTKVVTKGAAAYAGVVNGGGYLDMEGGSLESEKHAALWIRSARHVSVRDGARLIGRDGSLMHIDAAFSDAFSFSLDQDVIAQGDIEITPDDVAAGAANLTDIRVSLNGRSHWTGSTSVAKAIEVYDASRWTLTGNSSVDDLHLHESTLQLSAPGSNRFNRLTVGGNFRSDDGLIIFNGALGGDNSPIDYLHVQGDTSGDARIQVNNVRGLGAQTINGIKIIQIDGHSGANYTLVGRAVAGRYDYFLHNGGEDPSDSGNWYLRSELNSNPPSPCEDDPSAPGCNPFPDPDPTDPSGPEDERLPPVPCEASGSRDCGTPRPEVVRPEAGAYMVNLRMGKEMFSLGYDQRSTPQGSSRGWVRVDGASNGFSAADGQLDIGGNRQSLTVGADLLRHGGGSTVGVMLASGNASATSTSELSGFYARGKVKGEAVGVYGTWRAGDQDPQAGLHLHGAAQHARFRNSVEGIGLTTERYRSSAWQGLIQAGYAFDIGSIVDGSLYLEPQLQVGYTHWRARHHTESSGTTVAAQGSSGAFGRVGMRLYGAAPWRDSAQVQPYLSVNWLHDRSDTDVLMDDDLTETQIRRGRAEVSLGAEVRFSRGWQTRASLSRQQAGEYRQTSAEFGLSYSW